LGDEVDVGARGAEDAAHHLDVGQVLLVHAAQAGGAGLALGQRARVRVRLLGLSAAAQASTATTVQRVGPAATSTVLAPRSQTCCRSLDVL
ncbi:hypothetical protein DKP78_19315, partial [Enterococcus faecium]